MNLFYKMNLVEIVCIIITVFIFWFYRLNLPTQISVANLILYLSAFLLLQSLIRDLTILLIQKKTQEKSSQPPCMCVESTVGLTGILLGAGFIGLGISNYINMIPIAWIASITIVLITGFLIKDLVFQWNPWRIYIEKDHLNIVFSWKK